MKKSTKNRRARRPEPPAVETTVGDRDESGAGGAFPIVGVGASAGGLEAFSELLKNLPLDTGMGFVLVQHLDPQHESALTQLLARATSLPVREVTNNLRVEPNQVYVIPPNTDLIIIGGVLKLRARQRARTPNRSIDAFLEALAEDQRERAIGVILSGTATDGTLGLETIKAEGGITFAQDDSARYDSMPRSAVAAGCVDYVLSPENIARELGRIANHPHLAGAAGRPAALTVDDAAPVRKGPATPRINDDFKKTLLVLRNHSGVDFSLYKPGTIQRRLNRRMVLNRKGALAGYLQYLRGNASELDALYSDMLISVTSFFRNPAAFEILQRKVLPRLLRQRGVEPVRAWVLGCSTGQEAYSIAMAFVEIADKESRPSMLQVFATDLNDALLDKARQGLYPKSIAQDVSPARLRRFFVEEEGGYRVGKYLREMVVFARQNLLADPPFSRMDLIGCRNLLIYLESSVQKKVIPLFHYALKPDGFLFLGASESVGGFTDLFEPVDKKHRIYARKPAPTPAFQLPARKKPTAEAAPAETRAPRFPPRMGNGPPVEADGLRGEHDAQREADRVTINQFAPPGVLINSELQIQQFRGSTSAYLAPSAGKASYDVLKMARPGLMFPLRAAINKARKDNKTARTENVRVEQDGEARMVNLQVVPLKNLPQQCFLILFEDAEVAKRAAAATRIPAAKGRQGSRPATRAVRPPRDESRRVAELETELGETREYLQAIQEQHDAANEELQAANEEVQSANEELQSINEELETSKEELESSNEELTTVNEEMANRNAELNRLNSDLVNLQTSAHVAIVLLARDLTIRRFSVQAEKQFNLRSADMGRSVITLRHDLNLPDLESMLTEVIDTVCTSEHEVQDRNGRWFSLRVRPYLTPDNKVDGAVLVLVDIDALKRSEQAIAAARDYAENMIATVREPLLVLDGRLRVESANRSFYLNFGASPAETVGRSVFELGNRQWDIPGLRSLLEEFLQQSDALDDYAVTHDFEQLGRRTMLLNARRMRGPDRETERILLAIEDITGRTQTESALRESSERYRNLFNSIDEGFCIIEVLFDDHERPVDYRFLEVSPSFERQTGLKDAQGKRMRELSPQHEEHWFAIYGKIALTGEAARFENRAEQLHRWYDVYAYRFGEPEQRQVAILFNDITERKKTEGALRDSEERSRSLTATLRESDRHKDEFLAMLAHELRNPLAPIRNSIEIMRRVTALESSGAQQPATPNDPTGARARGLLNTLELALQTIERQVGQMVRLVDDLLDVSRITRGKIALRRERVELASIVHNAVEAASPDCESMDQELTATLPPEPVYLDADPARIAQVVGNLLSNACKYTDKGGRIWLTVEVDDSTLPASVVIRVRDTGIGIAAEQLPRVFDMFMQVDGTLERSRSGLGIGLTLVRSLAEVHGGTVEAHSAGIGRGSEFVVRLPIIVDASQALPRSAARTPMATAARRILVVDDNRDSADSLATLLNLSGHETQVVYDGLEAVEAATTFRPDIILLDIGLPGLNGYEAARRIRQRSTDRRLVLVALTGWGQEADRRRSQEAGFDAHMVKPVDDVTLGNLLADLPVS